MRLLVAFVCLIAVAGISNADENNMLKCFACLNCGEDSGIRVNCTQGEDTCMKMEQGPGPTRNRNCVKAEHCKVSVAGLITNALADSLWLSGDNERVYCCRDDYCNSAGHQLPNLILLVLSVIIVSLFMINN